MLTIRATKIYLGHLFSCLCFGVSWCTSDAVLAESSTFQHHRIHLGGYLVNRFDSLVSVSEPNIGAGFSIDPADAFGLDVHKAVLRIEGYYHFSATRSLNYSWYRVGGRGEKILDEEIDWIDENGDPLVLPIGAEVDTNLVYDIFKVAHLWSFYRSDQVTLKFGLGLNTLIVDIDLEAEATGQDVRAETVGATVPLPVVSFAVKYRMGPRWSWHLGTEIFTVAIDDWVGFYSDNRVGFDYQINDLLGLGFGIGNNSLDLKEEASKYNFYYDNRVVGFLGYLSFRF